MDFGDREWVTSDRIVPAWNSILQLPLQAIECSLVNVGALGKVFYKINCESLKQSVLLFNRLVAVCTAFFEWRTYAKPIMYIAATTTVTLAANFPRETPNYTGYYTFLLVIYQTPETMFHHICKTPWRETKLRRTFEYLVCGKTLSLEFNIYSQAELKLSKKLIEESKKYMQIKIRYPIPSISPVQSDWLYMSLKVV